jgi:uncharacterized protein YndB with AHSA1/START domain
MNEVRAEISVPVPRERAFVLFTADVDRWWRPGERYGGPDVLGHRFEPWVGGRFVEQLADRERELGRITAWSPPERLAFSWRQSNWRPDESTEVAVSFEQVDGGTRVCLRHHGFDGVSSDVGCEVPYSVGWRELLGWFNDAVTHDTKETSCT